MRELEWAKTRLIEHVQLNNASIDVKSLGGRPWSKIPKYCREAFMNQTGISIPQKLCNNEGLGISVANFLKAKHYKDGTIDAITKKTPAATRQLVLKSEGTMYHQYQAEQQQGGSRLKKPRFN